MPRPLPNKRWTILGGDIDAEARIQMEVGTHPIVARLLVQRGITTPEAAFDFLNPSPDLFHDPFLLPDAEPAVERLKQALSKGERIAIHGDYDGDGVTSAALWARLLRALGKPENVDVFVPHRQRDGYDMRSSFVQKARDNGVSLIVTTDCGIQRIDEVNAAHEFGIDVIVTDHHTPNTDGSLPEAVAVVNPHRHDSRYPFKELAGVGVAFRLGEALVKHLGHNVRSYRQKFLDLAAIGTVTDVVPLTGENRLIVKYGLEALQNTTKPGLRELICVAGYAEKTLEARSISFGLGPRLNAASRVDETQVALDLLMTKDSGEAHELARQLDSINIRRREESDRVMEEAMAQIAQQDMSESRCLVIDGSGWGAGIVGLVAGKIQERYCRPCVVIGVDEATGKGKGSARSPRIFNVFQAIEKCRDLLEEFGGHAQAAGLSVKPGKVEDFRAQMDRIARATLSEEDCVPTLEAATELDPSEMTEHLVEQLAQMAPFGSGNHEPLFVSRNVRVREVKRMGKEQQHLKLIVAAEGLNWRDTADAVWWHRGDLHEVLEPDSSLDLCYRPQFNLWNGRRSVQFLLEDVKPPEW